MHDRRLNVKLAVSACLVFDADPLDPRPAERVWRLLVNGDLSEAQVVGHIQALGIRRGGASIVSRARERRIDVRSLRMAPHYLREFGLSSVARGPVRVSVDLFNPADELGIGNAAGPNVVELFRVDGSDPDAFVDVARDLFDRTDATFLFGGASFYVETFIQLRGRYPQLEARELLWPLTGLLSGVPAHLLATAHRVSRGRGTVVQVFGDLWTGQAPEYGELARALGKRSFWEFAHEKAAGRADDPANAQKD